MEGITKPSQRTEKVSLKCVSAGLTDRGRLRSENQDALARIDADVEGEALGLYVVVDGMGGKSGGKKAAYEAVDYVYSVANEKDFFRRLSRMKGNDDKLERVLRKLVGEASKKVRKLDKGDTTMTMAMVIGNQVMTINAGDSRVYLVGRDGSFQRLTRDDSAAEEIVDMLPDGRGVSYGQLKSQIKKSLRVAVTSSYGEEFEKKQLDADELEVNVASMNPGDKLLLCSDGLWGMVIDDSWENSGHEGEQGEDWKALQNIVRENTPGQAVKALVELANARGGRDNITALVVEV